MIPHTTIATVQATPRLNLASSAAAETTTAGTAQIGRRSRRLSSK
jgi:hypothetical protein